MTLITPDTYYHPPLYSKKVTAALAGGLAARARARWSLRFVALCERGDRRARAWVADSSVGPCAFAVGAAQGVPCARVACSWLRCAITINLLVGQLTDCPFSSLLSDYIPLQLCIYLLAPCCLLLPDF